jgi:5'(3')-deoxyribonucleotidase
MKKIVYIDMDDTIADFGNDPVFNGEQPTEQSVSVMYEPGFFFGLKLIPGALSGVRALIRLGYDVHILTQPVAESAHSYSEKAQWIAIHFPELVSKIHMTQDKGRFLGDFLIDDNAAKWKEKFEKNGGKFIWFNHRDPDQWSKIVNYFKGNP